MSADAVFTLASEFDTQSLIKSAEDAVKEVKKIFESRGGAESPRLASIYAQIEKICNRVIKVGNELNKIGSEPVMTKEFASASKELDKLERTYAKLISKSEDMYAINEKYNALQDSINEKEAKRANAIGESVITYNKLLEDIATGRDSASSYSAYNDSVEKVRSIETEIANLQAESQKGEFLKASKWTQDVSDVTTAIRELRSVLSELEEQNQAYIPGTETDAYNQKILKLHEYLTALGIAEKKLDAYQQKEIDKAKDETVIYTELLRKREEARQKSDELAAQVTANEQIETNAVFASAQERIQAYEAEIAELNKRIAKEEQAAHHADVYNNSYNRVRESLMGIQSTARGLTRLIPGLETSALQGVVAVTRGITRLASEGKVAILGALQNIKTAFLKLFALIAAHPAITALIASIGLLIAGISYLGSKVDEFREKQLEELKENISTLTDVVKDAHAVIKDFAKNAIIVLAKAFGKLSTISIRVLITILQNLGDAIQSVVSIAEDTYKLLAKWKNGINDINEALSNLTSSLDYLEGAFSTAFSPILLYVEPLLTRFIDLAADAMNAIGMLFAKLLGQDSYTKVIRKQEDFNKSLKKTGKQAKESLAPFDKLNVISKTTGRDTKDDDLDVDFEEVDLSLITMEQLIENMREEGTELGNSLNETLEGIKWDNFITNAGLAGEAFGEFIDGFFSHPNLGSEIGEMLGSVINAINNFIANFFGNIDWSNLGEQFVNMVRSFIEAFDPQTIADAFDAVVNAIVDFLGSVFENLTVNDIVELCRKLGEAIRLALANIPWEKIKDVAIEIGKDLATFFNSIMTPENITAVADALAEAFNTAMVGIGTFAKKLEWGKIGGALATGLNDFIKHWDIPATVDAVNNIASGFFKMLHTAIVGYESRDKHGVKIWVGGIDWESIGNTILEFIKGIKWKNIAKYAVEISNELLEGFKTVWETIKNDPEALQGLVDAVVSVFGIKKSWKTAFDNVLKEDVAGTVVVSKIKQSISDALQSNSPLAETAKYLGAGLLEGVGKWLTSPAGENQTKADVVTSLIKSLWAKFVIHSPAETMYETGKWIAKGIIEGMGLVDFTASMTTWWNTNVSPWFTKNMWEATAKGVYDGVMAQMKLLKTAMTGNWVLIKEKSGEKIDKLIVSVTRKFNTLKSALDKTNAKMHDGFVDTFKDLAVDIKSPLQTIINVFALFSDKIIDCTNSMITNMNKFDIDMPSWLTGTSDKTFNFGLSKISHVTVPKLAQGTVIPPNMSQFLAVLGDNNKETEVVSPLSTIEQALRNVLTEQNVNVTFSIEGDPHGMFRVVQKEATSYTKRTGRLAF